MSQFKVGELWEGQESKPWEFSSDTRAAIQKRVLPLLEGQTKWSLFMIYRTEARSDGTREWRISLRNYAAGARGDDNPFLRVSAPEGDVDFLITQLEAII